MINTAYAVKDNLSNKFNGIIFFNSEEEAKRAFRSNVNNIEIWRDNPGDFDLWYIGTFDDETGELSNKDMNKVCNGRSVLNT